MKNEGNKKWKDKNVKGKEEKLGNKDRRKFKKKSRNKKMEKIKKEIWISYWREK